MGSERGAWTFGPIVGFIIVVLAVIGFFAVCGDEEADEDLLGRIELVSHDYGGYEEGCGRDGAGCGNERHEDYEGANCKYVCPQFDRSPVQDAFNFNPQVCLPGAQCHWEDRRGEEPSAEEGQP